MDPRHLDELIQREPSYWWHVSKRRLLLQLARKWFPPPGRLIEGGIGAGGNLRAMAGEGYEVSGLDVSEASVDYVRSGGLEDVRVRDLQEPWPYPDRSARLVVLLDVLEHLISPVRALSETARVLRPDGGAIVMVPAVPWLMGPWDRMLGHHRRYTRRMLGEQASAAGLRVLWCSSWNSFSLPPAIALRTVEKLRNRSRSAEFPEVAPWLNATLLRLADAERSWMRLAPVPMGLSLVGVLAP